MTTKEKKKQSRKPIHPEPPWFDWLLTSMFLKALPIWQRHGGSVPHQALRKLERSGDWPRGVAAAIMKRLTKDQDFRMRVRQLAHQRRTQRSRADEPAA